MLRVPGTDGDLLGAKAGAATFASSIRRSMPCSRPRQSRSRGRFLRRRLRDHRAGQRHGGLPRQARRATEFLDAGLARAGAAGHARHPRRRRPTGCRASSPPAMSAPSWATRNISRSRHSYRVPIVVTGFEPLDILEGIYLCVQQLEQGRGEVENQYAASVRRDGNRPAQDDHAARCSRSSHAAGAASARSPRAGSGSPTPIATTMPRAALRPSRDSATEEAPSASAGSSCAANEAARIAPPSARAARPSIRSASPWSRQKAPAPPITATAA